MTIKVIKCKRCNKCYFEYNDNDKCPYCGFDQHSITEKGKNFPDYLFDLFRKNSKGGK